MITVNVNATVHIHTADLDRILNAVTTLSTREQVMASVQDVKDAVAQEAAEVAIRVSALESEVQSLKDQIAAGTAATPEQLDEILIAVRGIFTPPSA